MTHIVKTSVLVIDDSPVVRERWADLLSSAANLSLVGLGANGVHGLGLFCQRAPDVVLLGIELPDLNGLELLERIKVLRPTCKVIVLTGYSFGLLRRRCLELGADFCFDKTTEFEKALAACQPSARPDGKEHAL